MKEIAIISNYFPPERGAASNRIYDLCEQLIVEGYKVSVICPLPNYPKGKIFKPYQRKLYFKECLNGISVYRLWIFPSNSKNLLLRLISMASFSLSLSVFFLNKQPKVIFVQSPPLLVSVTTLFWLSRSDRKIILNVSDLWPHSALAIGMIKKGFLYEVLLKLERYIYNKASVVVGQSQQIVSHVNGMFPQKPILLYRNYPRNKYPQSLHNLVSSSGPITIVYAGLLGAAQGIKKICEEILFLENIEFHIYGAGMESRAICDYLDNHSGQNITYHGEISREELSLVYQQYDIALVPLIRPIDGAVPSKIFELAQHGMPVLYFAGGEGEEIVINHKLGYVVKPSDHTKLRQLMETLNRQELQQMRQHIRATSHLNFNYYQQFDQFYKLLGNM